MWTLDPTNKQYLELKGRYSYIFRGIVATLSYLHSKGKFHGNLRDGIFVTGPKDHPGVCFTNFNIDAVSDFESGFKNDLEDLRYLMELAVEHFIKITGYSQPPALVAFYRLFNEMNKLHIVFYRYFNTRFGA